MKSLRVKLLVIVSFLLVLSMLPVLAASVTQNKATPAQEVATATGQLLLVDGSLTAQATSKATNLNLGNYFTRSIHIRNGASFNFQAIGLTVADSQNSILSSDATHGLQLELSRCNAVYASCSVVVASQPVLTPISNIAGPALSSGNDDYLSIKLTLPSTGNAAQFQGLTALLTYTFTAQQVYTPTTTSTTTSTTTTTIPSGPGPSSIISTFQTGVNDAGALGYYNGDIYAVYSSANVIKKINSAGVATTVAGSGTAGWNGDGSALSTHLNGPRGLTVAPNGDVYFVDTWNARVRKLSGGAITTVAGNGSSGYGGDNGPSTSAQISQPYSLAVSPDNTKLYILDTGNYRIRQVVFATNTITTIAGGNGTGYTGDNGPATSAKINWALGINVHSNGDICLADSGNNVIRKISGGTITRLAGSQSGSSGNTGEGGLATAATLNQPSSCDWDAVGNLYLTDRTNRVVKRINTSGIINRVAGTGSSGNTGDGGQAINATFNDPWYTVITPSGVYYVADRQNNNIRKIG